MLDVKPQVVVDADVLVCHPDEREERDEISPPAGIKKFELGNDQEERRDVMAEAIFAREKVEEFPARQAIGLFGLLLAVIARLAKNILVGDRPGDARDRYRQNQQPSELKSDRRHRPWMQRRAKASNREQSIKCPTEKAMADR